MHLLILFFIIIFCSGIVALLSDKRIEVCIPLIVLLFIVLEYVFGLLGILQFSIYLIYFLGAAALIGCIYLVMFKRKTVELILAPGLVVYLLLFGFVWWAQRGRMLTSWDEFSHWGLAAKNVYMLDSLALGPDSTTRFKDYPPAISLFQYLLMKVSGVYNEPDLPRAINILFFSLLIPLFANSQWKKWGRVITLLGIIIILPIAFNKEFYIFIYVDSILGALFGYVLYCHLSNPLSSYSLINTSLAVVVLSLVKGSGKGLAAIALLIIILTELVARGDGLREFIKKNGKIKSILTLSLPVLVLIVAAISWKLIISFAGIPSAKEMNIADGFPPFGRTTIYNFLVAFSSSPLLESFINVTPSIWLALLYLPVLVSKWKETDYGARKIINVFTILTYCGMIVYLASLLMVFIFSFTEYESVRLASYPRYVSTYLFGMAIFYVSFLILKAQRQDGKHTTKILVTLFVSLALIVNLAPLYDITIFQKSKSVSTVAQRAPYNELNNLGNIVGKNEKVYFLSIADKGFDYYVAKYIVSPIKISPAIFSIGEKPYYEGDIWTFIMSKEKWAETLKDYDYVYVFKANDEFRTIYGELFDGGKGAVTDKSLYKIEKTVNAIKLTPVRLE